MMMMEGADAKLMGMMWCASAAAASVHQRLLIVDGSDLPCAKITSFKVKVLNSL